MKGQNFDEYLRSLNLVFLALLAGQILMTAVFFFITENASFEMKDELDDIFIFLVPAMMIFGFIASKLIFQQRLAAIQNVSLLNKKLVDYRAAAIVKYALIEGPTLFALICFFLTANYYYLCFAGILMLYFLMQRPSKDSLIAELKLDREQMQKVRDPKVTVAEVEGRA